MQFRNSANSYGAVAKGFHWLTAALVILAWALGSFDDVLPKGPARAAGLFVHMSAGLTIIAALAARLLWRLADAPPLPEPSALGVWLDRALVYTDNKGVDGVVNGVAAAFGGTSSRLRKLQTGFVRSYALSMLGGAVLLVAALIVVRF